MKSVSKQRKKLALEKLNASKKPDPNSKVYEGLREQGYSDADIKEMLDGLKAKTNASRKLNSAKQVEGEWFYSLTDVEDVVAAVLAELDKDNGAAITLSATETGISLEVTSSEGEEFSVPVDLGIEGDETPMDDMPAEESAEDESSGE